MKKTMTYHIAAHTVNGHRFPAFKSIIAYDGNFEAAAKKYQSKQRKLLAADNIKCETRVTRND